MENAQDLTPKVQPKIQPDISQQAVQQPHTNIVPSNITPPMKQNLPEKKTSKLLIIIPIVLFVLVLSAGMAYFLFLQKDDKVSEKTIPTPLVTCDGVDMSLPRNISHPMSTKEIILFNGMFSKSWVFSSGEWYMLPEGSYDPPPRDQSGDLTFNQTDKDNNILYSYLYDTNRMFTLLANPGGAIETDTAPFALSLHYPWNARSVYFEKDGVVLYEQNIQEKLIKSAINTLADNAFPVDRASFTDLADEILYSFTDCLSKSEVASSRILEFKLLPLVESGLVHSDDKQILETNKNELINIIKNSAARLDPSITTAELTPTPTPNIGPNIKLRDNIREDVITNAYLSLGKGVRFGEQAQLDLIEFNYPESPQISPWPEGLVVDEDQPEYAKVQVTNVETGETEEFIFYGEDETASAFGYFMRVTNFMPHLSSIDLNIGFDETFENY